jgi:hypothetical protein
MTNELIALVCIALVVGVPMVIIVYRKSLTRGTPYDLRTWRRK